MNTFKFYIFKPYTKEAITASVNYRIPGNFEEVEATPVYPLGIGNFLDERLDEAYITIYNSSTKHFKAKTICKIEIYERTTYEPATTKYYIIGNDNSVELPVGSGTYRHELFLIEPTKLLEGIQCQSIAFTNALKQTSVESAQIKVIEHGGSVPSEVLYDAIVRGYTLPIPRLAQGEYFLPSIKAMGDSLSSFWLSTEIIIAESIAVKDLYDGKHQSEIYIEYDDGENTGTYDINTVVKISKNATVTYKICFNTDTNVLFHVKFSFDIAFKIDLPIMPYTITTMTQRCLELAEPVFSDAVRVPRISFDGCKYIDNAFGCLDEFDDDTQAKLYNKTLATEVTLTQNNLREQLKTIGHLIHAEPRLNIIEEKSSIGFNLFYESYNVGDEVSICRPYVYKALNQSINDYCDSIRTNAKNIVNLLDYAQGTLIEPIATYKNVLKPAAFKSVRTDNINIRITDANGICETALPIYEIIKVECGVIAPKNFSEWASNGFDGSPVDITNYVVEKSFYDTLDAYSYNGKAMAIYYTRGQKNIGGIFFKRMQLSISEAFDYFAITNIFHRITGTWLNFDDAVKLVFRVTYVPMYNVTFSHGKQSFTTSELFEPTYTIPYNQSENIVESRFYGENVKGVAARLGNVECERTYIFDKLSEIPKNGQILAGYTICASNTQILPTHYKTTLALSKDFNRINQYVGVSQNKRTYEISEYESYERNIVLNAKVIITTNSDMTVSKNGLRAPESWFRDLITATNVSTRQICNVVARGFTKARKPLQPVLLPVIASSFGNVISFTWSYKDNYSAGEQSAYYEEEISNTKISGYWSKDVPYCDNYGNIFSYQFALLPRGVFAKDILNKLADASIALPLLTDTQYAVLYGKKDIYVNEYLLKKDSREKLTFNAQFEFVTDVNGLIIGSALASASDLTSYTERRSAKLYLIKEKISKFDSNIASKTWVECRGPYNNSAQTYDALVGNKYTNGIDTNGIYIDFKKPFYNGFSGKPITKGDYQSWALAREPEEKNITYINDFGQEESIPQQVGGEILIASNTIPEGILELYFKITS